MDATLEVPAIVVGLGPFGARVTRRLVDEQREASGQRAPDELLPTVIAEHSVSPDQIADAVVAEARRVLAHGRMVVARDAAGADGLTRLHIYVVANVGEGEARAAVAPVLAAVERRILVELGPIFESYRTGAERNLVLLPVLAMPHPAAHAEGKQIVDTVKGLCRDVARTPHRQRAVPQVFLIEDVAEFSVLSESELEQCVRNFMSLLLYSLSAVPRVSDLIYGREPHEPLATFVCSVAELPRSRLASYATDRVALEVVDAVLAETGDDIDLAEIDAIEEVELADLDEPKDADRDVLELLNRYAPPVDRDQEPPWWDRAEAVRSRYGPDPADASLDEHQPSPEPPVGWALERMREIEQSWRLLQRRRFDDVIAREREDVKRLRDGVLERLRKRVDRSLWADPAPDAFRRTATLVSRFERAISLRLEDAVRERDAALPVSPPSFDSFRDAHAHLLDEARRKPDLGRMGLYGALALAAAVVFGPVVLGALATALGVAETDWQSPWLRERAWLTSALLVVLAAGTFLGLRFRAAVIVLRRAFHDMYEALEETVTGMKDSVLEYFASRLRLARQVARVEALLAVRAAVIGDVERLTLLDRAVRRARGHLLESQRRIGAARNEHGEDDISELLGARGESLVESLVPLDAGRFIDRMLPAEARDSRIRDVLHSLARDQLYQQRWREEVPFTSIEALRRAAGPHAAHVAEWDPFADPESAEATCVQIAAFTRRQARSLHVALNVSGHEVKDMTGTTSALSGDVIVPPSAYDDVRQLLSEQGAGGRVSIPVLRGVDPDRAFYVLTVGDIAEAAVASLETSGGEAVAFDDRFEIERPEDG